MWRGGGRRRPCGRRPWTPRPAQATRAPRRFAAGEPARTKAPATGACALAERWCVTHAGNRTADTADPAGSHGAHHAVRGQGLRRLGAQAAPRDAQGRGRRRRAQVRWQADPSALGRGRPVAHREGPAPVRRPPLRRLSKKKAAKAKAAGLKLERRPQVTIENPFERKVQRVKHEVLGRKIKGHEGKPTLSRSRAQQKVRRPRGRWALGAAPPLQPADSAVAMRLPLPCCCRRSVPRACWWSTSAATRCPSLSTGASARRTSP